MLELPFLGKRDSPQPSRDNAALRFADGASAQFLFRVPAGAHFDLRAEPDSGRPRIAVTLETKDAPSAQLLEGAAPVSASFELPGRSDQLARLSLTVTGGSLRVVDAALRGRPGDRPAPIRAAGGTRARNVVIFLVDTLRADHLGCYGYSRPTSPQLDAFARQASLFENAVAQASWTRPAVASIFTGLNPTAHGAVRMRSPLRPRLPALATILAARGYRTAGFVTNLNVAPRWGFGRGFQTYRYLPEDDASPTVHVRADALREHARAWLEDHAKNSRSTPFLLYLHASDPHAPYTPPAPLPGTDAAAFGDVAQFKSLFDRLKADPKTATAGQVQALVDAYDAEIAFADAQFGQLLDDIRRLDFYDDTAIVFLSDHGEEFNDHGRFEHGRALYQETVRIPLVLRLPGVTPAGGRIASIVRQTDLLPTLLEYLGIPPPERIDGTSLLAGASDALTAPLAVEATSHTSLASPEEYAVFEGRQKVILSGPSQEGREVYDLVADPAEGRNLAASSSLEVDYARMALAAQRKREPRTHMQATPTLDAATADRLRALGYSE